MKLHLEPVTAQNRAAALALELFPEQAGFVECVEQCLREAEEYKNWRPMGIYDGETLVGFAMYGFFPRESLPFGRLWLDRFLIDRRFQGRGYGRAALAAALALLAQEFPGKQVYLSVTPGNHAAARLYQSFGFRFNGEKDIHGEDVMVHPPAPL